MDNIQFENRYEITKTLVNTWNKVSQKRRVKQRIWLDLLLKIMYCIAGFLYLISGILLNDTFNIVFGILFLLLGITLIFSSKLVTSLQFKNYAQLQGKTTWNQSIRFKDKIEIENGNTITTYSYEQINYIDENDECFYLWIGTTGLIVVYKNAFIIGKTTDFYQFINNKCSNSLWTINKLNSNVWKKMKFRIILLITLCILSFVPLIDIKNNFNTKMNFITINQAIRNQIDDNINPIIVVELDNNVVFFGTDEENKIYALLLELKSSGYEYVTSHYFIISDIDNYNLVTFSLFETQKDILPLKNNKEIVYGIATALFWNETSNFIDEFQYTTTSFYANDIEYVFYYRIIED